MELRHLRYFKAVAHTKHFTRAAEELNLAQPALSQQIQQLERELGIALLERTSRQVRLTSAGEAFLIRAERILAEVERAQMEMQEFAGLTRGRVVIGALQSLKAFRFSSLLARFHVCYPGIEVVLREEATEKLLELLNAGRLDLSFLQVMGNDALVQEIPASSIATEKLLTEEVVLAVAPGHPLEHATQITIEELRGETFVAFKPGSGLRRLLHQMCLAAGFTPHVLFESGDLGTICSLVAEGLGISLLPRSVAEAAGRGIVSVSFGPQPIVRTILLAWPTHIAPAPATTAFLAFIRKDRQEYFWG